MNIFVLNIGRCGSATFIKACKHISNFTAAHESRSELVGDKHFQYPDNHIEADNRLSWMLGRLEKAYGDNAMYVHLTRDLEKTAKSQLQRYNWGMIQPYRTHMLMGLWRKIEADPLTICRDYCETLESNIELFLKDKSHQMHFKLENAKEDFRTFWHWIGAEGDLEAALAEFDITHNDTASFKAVQVKPMPERIVLKIGRVLDKLPSFIKEA